MTSPADVCDARSTSMATKKTKGPTFLRFVAPIVETLRELGNSGTSAEVADRVLDRLKVSEQEQEETTSNGHSRVRNQIGWARFYLAKAGYLDASQRGVWRLTEVGRMAKLDADAIRAMFKEKVQKKFPRKATTPDSTTGAVAEVEDEDEDVETAEELKDYKVRLLDILRALPPSRFERICQRLLRESGFQQVVVTGALGATAASTAMACAGGQPARDVQGPLPVQALRRPSRHPEPGEGLPRRHAGPGGQRAHLDDGQLHERCAEGSHPRRRAAHRAGGWREARRDVRAGWPGPSSCEGVRGPGRVLRRVPLGAPSMSYAPLKSAISSGLDIGRAWPLAPTTSVWTPSSRR